MDAKQTIDQKIIALLNIFIDEKLYKIDFSKKRTLDKLPLTIYDSDIDFLAVIIDTPIAIYKFLLEATIAISFCRKQPLTRQEILFERIRNFRSQSIFDISNINITNIETF